MKLPIAIVGILVGAVLGILSSVIYPLLGLLPPLLGICIGACVGGIAGIFTSKRLVIDEQSFRHLPKSTVGFITLVIKKMRYRKKIRAEVMDELAAHFEDELQSCETDDEKKQKAQNLIEDFGDAKLLGILLRRAKKRCRPLWRTVVARTFQTIGVLILCFIFYCVYISLGKPAINVNYIEEATLLTRPVADESLNAAPIYQKAIDAYKEPPLVKSEPETEEIDLLHALRGKDGVMELTEEELALLTQWLSDNADASEFFKRASEKPHCWWKRQAEDDFIITVLMPELRPLRNITKMMVWQAKLKAHDGHIEEALDDLLVCYRVGRHLKGPRSLVEQLVGIAIQALSTKNALVILDNQEVDTQLLKNLQIQLEELMAEDIYTISYEVERFLALDFIQRCYTNNGKGSGHMIPGRVQEFMFEIWGDSDEEPLKKVFLSLAASIASADRREMSRKFDKFYNAFEERTTKTPWQLHKENIDLEMGLGDWSFYKKARYWPIDVLMPALGAVNRTAYRHKAQVDALITTLAIIRFKKSTGNYPESLHDLVAEGYLKHLPMDPYSDKPLVYRKVEDHFTLYSVGQNFNDDGGEVARGEEGKVKKWADEGDTVFWPMQK